jgi:hypothetical protein
MQVDPAYTESYLFRGELLLAQESHDVALIAFSQASALEKSMAAYAGGCSLHYLRNFYA